MLALNDVGKYDVPWVTGPHALKRAFLRFMGAKMTDTFQWCFKDHPLKRPAPGYYYGWQNRSLYVDGNATHSNLWVHRDKLNKRVKVEGWKMMNLTEYKHKNKVAANKTCLQHIMEYYQQHPFPSGGEVQQEMHRLRI